MRLAFALLWWMTFYSGLAKGQDWGFEFGLGYFAETNQVTSTKTGSIANLSSSTGEALNLNLNYLTGPSGIDYYFQQKTESVVFTNDPRQSLGFSQTISADYMVGFKTPDTTIESFSWGLRAGAKEFIFFSADNFTAFGIVRAYVPKVGGDLLWRPFFIGRRVRLGVKGSADYLFSTNQVTFTTSGGYQYEVNGFLELLRDAHHFRLQAGGYSASQSTTLGTVTDVKTLISLFFISEF